MGALAMIDFWLFIAAIAIAVVGGYLTVTQPYSTRNSDMAAWASIAVLFVVVVALIARVANGN